MSKNKFKIKKQINILYITSALGNFSITGAWVAILAARGFSLVEIGLAETIFHITSLIFEIPSGMLADLFGRKKMLILSQIMGMIGCLIMAATDGFFGVCFSFVFQALSYNCASGTGDALAYDSLKLVSEEDRYEKYAANELMIYRIGEGVSTLLCGVALAMGYKPAYYISAAWHVIIMLVTLLLTEVTIEKPEYSGENVFVAIYRHFKSCIKFLIDNKKATGLMFANSLIGAVDILLLFFLQSKLSDAGMPDLWLGVALLIMELGGVGGTRIITRVKSVGYWLIFTISAIGVITGVLLEHTSVIWIMTLGGFVAAACDDMIQTRTDARLQDMFSSDKRATLISISSFTFSVIMIMLSPLAGYFFEKW